MHLAVFNHRNQTCARTHAHNSGETLSKRYKEKRVKSKKKNLGLRGRSHHHVVDDDGELFVSQKITVREVEVDLGVKIGIEREVF